MNSKREMLKQILIQTGLENPEEAARVLGVSRHEAVILLKKLSDVRELRFNKNPRLVNRFMVGADPEFIFLDPAGGRYDANRFGLKTGTAFGADMNGRLAEIRVAPHRWVVRVVASMVETLRWGSLLMGNITPEGSHPMMWTAVGYVRTDGIGGHIHFGRLRGDRAKEIESLDSLAQLLIQTGVFSEGECQARLASTPYGKAGDVRFQKHGYEYRTMPTWLDSPWMAYLVLTLAKLVVFSKEKLSVGLGVYGKGGRGFMKNLLGAYKGVDDDARLALWALQKFGWPVRFSGDFRSRWGAANVKAPPEGVDVNRLWIPDVIEPSGETLEEVFLHLCNGAPITDSHARYTWTPTSVLPEFVPLISTVETVRIIGIGEIVWDLCSLRNRPTYVISSDDRVHVSIQRTLADILPTGWKALFHERGWPVQVRGEGWNIFVPRQIREDPIQLCGFKELLVSGVFPVWKIGTENEEAAKQWLLQKPQVQKTRLWGIKLLQ